MDTSVYNKTLRKGRETIITNSGSRPPPGGKQREGPKRENEDCKHIGNILVPKLDARNISYLFCYSLKGPCMLFILFYRKEICHNQKIWVVTYVSRIHHRVL